MHGVSFVRRAARLLGCTCRRTRVCAWLRGVGLAYFRCLAAVPKPETTNHEPINGRSKCSLRYLEARLKEMSIEWAPLWQQIIGVCLKTLYCVQDVIPVMLVRVHSERQSSYILRPLIRIPRACLVGTTLHPPCRPASCLMAASCTPAAMLVVLPAAPLNSSL